MNYVISQASDASNTKTFDSTPAIQRYLELCYSVRNFTSLMSALKFHFAVMDLHIVQLVEELHGKPAGTEVGRHGDGEWYSHTNL